MNERLEITGIRLDPSRRTRCEVWTRVMGYHRPVSEFNLGKKGEHEERTHFIEPSRESLRTAVCC